MGIEIKNLFQLPHIIKIPELILALIIVIIQRIGMIGSDLYPIDYLNFYLPTIEEASGPSMSFYPDFIQILSRFYLDFILILS